mgnify:CR=1 FL=1
MPAHTTAIRTKCTTCTAKIQVQKARFDKFKKHYCSRKCQGQELYSWVGYIVSNCRKYTQKEIAAKIGVNKNTYLSLLAKLREMGIKVGYYVRPEAPEYQRKKKEVKPKVKPMGFEKIKPIIEMPPNKGKTRDIRRKDPKPAVKPLPNKVENRPFRLVRIDRRTQVQVHDNRTDEQVIEDYYKRKTG